MVANSASGFVQSPQSVQPMQPGFTQAPQASIAAPQTDIAAPQTFYPASDSSTYSGSSSFVSPPSYAPYSLAPSGPGASGDSTQFNTGESRSNDDGLPLAEIGGGAALVAALRVYSGRI